MRKCFIFFTAIIFAVSCTNKQSAALPVTNNEALIKQYFVHFNKHDWKAMAAMYADSAEFKDPSLGPGIVKQTQQQIRDKYAALAAMFPNVRDSVVQLYASGNEHIIVEFISTGTAPDNSKFELPVCTIFTIQNGKITKDFTYYDNFEDPASEE